LLAQLTLNGGTVRLRGSASELCDV